MVGLVRAIEVDVGASVDELNLGGGLGVRYLSDDAPPTIEQYATAVHEAVGKALADAGVRSRSTDRGCLARRTPATVAWRRPTRRPTSARRGAETE